MLSAGKTNQHCTPHVFVILLIPLLWSWRKSVFTKTFLCWLLRPAIAPAKNEVLDALSCCGAAVSDAEDPEEPNVHGHLDNQRVDFC